MRRSYPERGISSCVTKVLGQTKINKIKWLPGELLKWASRILGDLSQKCFCRCHFCIPWMLICRGETLESVRSRFRNVNPWPRRFLEAAVEVFLVIQALAGYQTEIYALQLLLDPFPVELYFASGSLACPLFWCQLFHFRWRWVLHLHSTEATCLTLTVAGEWSLPPWMTERARSEGWR